MPAIKTTAQPKPAITPSVISIKIAPRITTTTPTPRIIYHIFTP